jgi:hypothetical protein
MNYFAGLDVSVRETSVCIVDGTGKLVREVEGASDFRTTVSGVYRICGESAGNLSEGARLFKIVRTIKSRRDTRSEYMLTRARLAMIFYIRLCPWRSWGQIIRG